MGTLSLAACTPAEWAAFMAGYQSGHAAGLQTGMCLGRDELVAELKDVTRAVAKMGLGQHMSRDEIRARQQRRGYDRRTPDQVRVDAYTSWGLTPTPTSGTTASSSAASRDCPRGGGEGDGPPRFR